MTLADARPSIHIFQPQEFGGVIARQGFIFQDHVAVGFCLGMLADSRLNQVFCETLDDITLIWNSGQAQEVEFVQVKSNDFKHFWSVAELYKREKKLPGTSILERSLGRDQFKEPSCFRIVTTLGVNTDLEILKFPLVSPYRSTSTEDFQKLWSKVHDEVRDCRSPNGSDCQSWLAKTLWDVRHSTDAVEHKNLLTLTDFATSVGAYLAPDQNEELYKKLLTKAREAADADPRYCLNAKKIRREDFELWLTNTIDEISHPASKGGGNKLYEKMQLADLPRDAIESAYEARRRYHQVMLNPEYLEITDRELAADEVKAVLRNLRSQLDNDRLADSGVDFHDKCLSALGELQDALPAQSRVPLSFLHGCMYDIADRCLHRFRKVSA